MPPELKGVPDHLVLGLVDETSSRSELWEMLNEGVVRLKMAELPPCLPRGFVCGDGVASGLGEGVDKLPIAGLHR